MDKFLQQLINGATVGSVYALVALGYTMVYGIIGLINFAHGEVVMIGAMVVTVIATALALAYPGLAPVIVLMVCLLAAIPVCMGVGWASERIAYRPLRTAPRLSTLITAIGVSIILQNGAMMIWGKDHLKFPQLFEPVSHAWGSVVINNVQLAIMGTAALIMGGLWLLVHRTRLGVAMRATSQNREVAGLMGINIDRVISSAFLVGAFLAAVAGLMISIYYGLVNYYMGFMLGLKAFTAAVLGGIGNLTGAMVGGVLLGIIEALAAGYIGDLTNNVFGSHYQDVFAFIVLVGVLIFRPAGLLGQSTGERA